MKTKIWLSLGLGAVLIGAVPVSRVLAGADDEFSPEKLAALRAEGPQGLEKLIAAHESEIKLNAPHPPQNDADWQKLCAALDEVGGQKDNYAARLFWFTDLEAAKKASREQKKPILSLRMLGKLTDELSCANSRFFRTALYPNAQISKNLRENFILHWSSERPVPVVTIDFGDGRQIKRTLTGNSAHYLLDSEGKPLDVLPGLYGPGAFEKWLETSEKLFADYEAKPQAERGGFLADWHKQALLDSLAGPEQTKEKYLKPVAAQILRDNPLISPQPPARSVNAEIAGAITVSKMASEVTTFSATRLMDSDALDRVLTDGDVMQARPYVTQARLDAASRNFLRAKRPILAERVGRSVSVKPPSQFVAFAFPNSQLLESGLSRETSPFEQVVQNFERAMAFDTARNETRFHQPIHALFAEEKQGTFEELNRKIYDRLFLTPQSDPWLGLKNEGIYSGLQNGGLTSSQDPKSVIEAQNG